MSHVVMDCDVMLLGIVMSYIGRDCDVICCYGL